MMPELWYNFSVNSEIEIDGCAIAGYVMGKAARRVAHRWRGWSPDNELLLYVAHGMDHLSGADDADDADDAGYMRMRRRELRWMSEWRRGASMQ